MPLVLIASSVVAPTTVLGMALGDSIQGFVDRVSDQSLQVPEPPASVAAGR